MATIFKNPKKIDKKKINLSSNNSLILKKNSKNNFHYKKNKQRKKLRIKTLKTSNKRIKSFSHKKENFFDKENYENNNKEKINLPNRGFRTNNLIRRQNGNKSSYDKKRIYYNDTRINLMNINKIKKEQYNKRNNLPYFTKDNFISKSQKTNYDN